VSNLRILVVHNRYQDVGGEDTAVSEETKLLKSHGHQVLTLEFDNSQISTVGISPRTMKLAIETVWSFSARRRLQECVRRFRPDITHFHNTFPLVSPAAYQVCQQERIAVVQSLHNYRIVCANGLQFRAGRHCEDCLGLKVPWPAIMHRCYRRSTAATAVTMAMLGFHNLRDTWRRDVDLYVAPSEYARETMVRGGLPGNRVTVKRHFIDDPGQGTEHGQHFLFVGGGLLYKGIDVLIRAWEVHDLSVPLRILGPKELPDDLVRRISHNQSIEYLGAVSRSRVLREMKSAFALIMPSLVNETLGLAAIEAFACATPVLAARVGALPEVVDDGRTGLLFAPDDTGHLAQSVRWLVAHPHNAADMGRRARAAYEARFSAKAGYRDLIAAYDHALEFRQRLGA
jgi:glycosyltransferase involved in cell wall biosynthesis